MKERVCLCASVHVKISPTCNACSFIVVHFIPMGTTLATISAVFIAGVALEWHTVLAHAYGHAIRRTDRRASGPRFVLSSVFAALTRWSLHATPASPAISRAMTERGCSLFALVPSSTWNTGRYVLPFVGSGAKSPLAVADAGIRCTSPVSISHRDKTTYGSRNVVKW